MNRDHMIGSQIFRCILCLLIGAAVFILFSACGRKADPMPPTAVPPPVVQNFQANMDGLSLQLSWPVPKWEGSNGSYLAGFYVYGSKESLSDEGCKDCPHQFERVGDLRLDPQTVAPEVLVTYKEPLEKGFRYYYKVVCYTDSGNEGEFSKIVTIDY